MSDSRNQPDLETLDYRAPTTEKLGKESYESHHFERPPETLGMNSRVIKPGVRANKAEDAEHTLKAYKPPKCALADDNGGILANPEHMQPNLKIIEEIEGLISQVNEKLCKITTLSGEGRLTVRRTQLKGQALEEIDLLQKTTLHELRKAFEL